MLGEDCRGDPSYKFECFGIVASTGLYGLTMTHLTRKRKNKINQRRLSPEILYFGAEDTTGTSNSPASLRIVQDLLRLTYSLLLKIEYSHCCSSRFRRFQDS